MSERKKEKKIGFYEDNPIWEKLETLKEIYNVRTTNGVVEHIVDLEMKRQWIKK